MSVRSLSNISVVVQSVAETSDNLGSGGTKTPSNKFDSYKCRLQPLKGTETIEFGKETVRITHRLYADFGQGKIVESDRIVFDGETYDVLLVRDVDRMGRHWEVDLELVK